MPLYEYKCHSCGAVFEARQTFSDQHLQSHEGCGGKVERLLSVPALQFKGTGWYVTDYARKSSNGQSSAEKPAKDSKKESPAGSESKPADNKPAPTTSAPSEKKP